MTLDEWAGLPEDEPGELVDGRLEEEEVSDFVHDFILIWLGQVFRRWLGRRGFVAGSEVKYAATARRGRKPDLAVFLPGGKTPPARGIVRVPPDVMVEIVSTSPRDVRRDRIDKMDDYAAFGVRWYWILDPGLRSLEIFELGDDGRYRRVLATGEAPVRAVPGCRGLVLDLPELWRETERLEQPGDRHRRHRR